MQLPWTNEEEKAIAIAQQMAKTDILMEHARALEGELTATLNKVGEGAALVRLWANSPASGQGGPFLIIDGGVSDSENSEEK